MIAHAGVTLTKRAANPFVKPIQPSSRTMVRRMCRVDSGILGRLDVWE